ncbi:hypothetical protein KSI01_18930 [Kurthia sibirica]|uniref:Uncharacterized protein n=1 Tax=Kurthia sibirica TaxID=202750 RepID=A0A2U3ALI5_9BACL|nr:hypothetical protein DEX24_08690 [Kurthia sibirica]GEK34360.1 hypothetical protein KSI01_18930 [Kurthia sibirica]
MYYDSEVLKKNDLIERISSFKELKKVTTDYALVIGNHKKISTHTKQLYVDKSIMPANEMMTSYLEQLLQLRLRPWLLFFL